MRRWSALRSLSRYPASSRNQSALGFVVVCRGRQNVSTCRTAAVAPRTHDAGLRHVEPSQPRPHSSLRTDRRCSTLVFAVRAQPSASHACSLPTAPCPLHTRQSTRTPSGQCCERARAGRADARGGHATLAALVLAATSDPSPARPLLVSSSYHTPHHTPSPHRHKRTRRSHITPNRPLYTSKSQMLPRHARRQRDHATHDPRAAAAALTERSRSARMASRRAPR